MGIFLTDDPLPKWQAAALDAGRRIRDAQDVLDQAAHVWDGVYKASVSMALNRGEDYVPRPNNEQIVKYTGLLDQFEDRVKTQIAKIHEDFDELLAILRDYPDEDLGKPSDDLLEKLRGLMDRSQDHP